jgi:two-component system CheB/CheR fusion protein
MPQDAPVIAPENFSLETFSPENFSVVAIGASAGGLDACRKLIAALPANSGMAFILVQHLDPTHESLMVDLLASYTQLPVLQAKDGLLIEPDHFYIIPPGTYLATSNGRLQLSQPQARHGARLPFDFLLHSLAQNYGSRCICIVLSGTGADGSLGLPAVKSHGGLIIVQDPAEADYDGMPKNAILTGLADSILPVADIPAAIAKHRQQQPEKPSSPMPADSKDNALRQIIDLLRAKTSHNFTLYKYGTLQRRIERRMSMTGIDAAGMNKYLKLLQTDQQELDLLAKDLLINVTSFFRDAKVFETLAEKIIPGLVRDRAPDLPLRIWIAGCSTGEETYSLAMLFREEITRSDCNVKLQVFASDIDADAVSAARDGLYPASIEAEVSADRLARFFTKEDHNYRVLPELRACVVFSVQDVLSDPPFSRIDLVSCRNLLIYLQPEAQAKVISAFHFALRNGGFLVLGSAETIGNASGYFEEISKSNRIFRHIGRSRPGEFSFLMNSGDSLRAPSRPGSGQPQSRQAALAELCRRLVLDNYAPAAVLINRKNECLYSLGPIERYLRLAAGHPTHDLLAMAPQDLRIKLRSAIQKAQQENVSATVSGGTATHDDTVFSFNIEVRPVSNENEPLLLICFVDDIQQAPQSSGSAVNRKNPPKAAALEHELKAVRAELQGAIRNLEISSDEQKAINEEALSINEEYQSTNEELLTSKEELQSLNEELTALNSQLQETLERQRTTSNDLQNVLFSTDVATLFLDIHLNIRFFTPATKSLFSIIPGDIGRPLADLNSLAADDMLEADARTVLQYLSPLEREIQTPNSNWFIRRVLPYRTHDKRVEGVVITFTDITERKTTTKALEAAKLQAEIANISKSRFLASASHDLRQPLQTLALLQGLLAKMMPSEPAQKLIRLLEQTCDSMSGMLNTLLDINQIDAGIIHPEMIDFPIGDLLTRLKHEFSYLANEQGLGFDVVHCSLSIHSDPRLLEQMIRNLISNALKYTQAGRVLLGCRRRDGMLSIEIWDTGIGIPEAEVKSIFEEYYQLENPARERARGLGLGLSIVQRLSALLGHRLRVSTRPGKGSVFAIEVSLTLPENSQPNAGPSSEPDTIPACPQPTPVQRGAILIVEDDPELRELLEMLMQEEGYIVTSAPDGIAALALVARGAIKPDLVLADFNLPNGLNGLQFSARLREQLHSEIPIIILTGDISTGTLRDIDQQHCTKLNKPVKLNDLLEVIQNLLSSQPAKIAPAAAPRIKPTGNLKQRIIYIVDDDDPLRKAMRTVFEEEGCIVLDFRTCEAFLESYQPSNTATQIPACLLIDAYLPGMSGLQLLQSLHETGNRLPAIMITGNSDVPMAVEAMKAGASDFIEKPVSFNELLASVERAIEQSEDAGALAAWHENAATYVAGLTARQQQIMEMVVAGQPSKNIAADLGISQRTVENHRAAIMKKTESKSLPALARIAFAAGFNEKKV